MKPSSINFTKPGTQDEQTSLGQLSRTGGIVNAMDALKLASTIKGERKAVEGSTNQPNTKTKK
jgi:hypothetical protein